MGKYKVVEILMGLGGGCGNQISKKESHVLNPLRVLEKRGFKAEIWTLQKRGADVYEGLNVRRFSNIFSLLWRLLLDRDIKLVYAQLRAYPPSLLSPLSLKKCILMTQTYELGSNWMIKKLSLFFMNKFTRIFALTPYEKELYIRNGLREDRVVYFPHAIDYSFFSEKPKVNLDRIREKYGIGKDDFVITSVANFRKFKNLDVMVEAFALFNKKVKKSKMLIVGKDQTGKGIYKEQGSKRYSQVKDTGEVVKKEGISKDVIFTGGVDYKKVRDILYISDVFVNSSDPEGMGMAVYEAGAAGVPLCLSNIGSFTSVFKDMALYNSPRDKGELVQNYLRFYRSPVLRKKISKRLKAYIKKWDYPFAIKKFDRVFSEVLGTGGQF